LPSYQAVVSHRNQRDAPDIAAIQPQVRKDTASESVNIVPVDGR